VTRCNSNTGSYCSYPDQTDAKAESNNDGVLASAERLAHEWAYYLNELYNMKEGKKKMHFHIAGHSLGGVLIRLAIARLPHILPPEVFKCIKKESIFVYSSPWLGCMMSGSDAVKYVKAGQRSYQEMILRDRLTNDSINKWLHDGKIPQDLIESRKSASLGLGPSQIGGKPTHVDDLNLKSISEWSSMPIFTNHIIDFNVKALWSNVNADILVAFRSGAFSKGHPYNNKGLEILKNKGLRKDPPSEGDADYVGPRIAKIPEESTLELWTGPLGPAGLKTAGVQPIGFFHALDAVRKTAKPINMDNPTTNSDEDSRGRMITNFNKLGFKRYAYFPYAHSDRKGHSEIIWTRWGNAKYVKDILNMYSIPIEYTAAYDKVASYITKMRKTLPHCPDCKGKGEIPVPAETVPGILASIAASAAYSIVVCGQAGADSTALVCNEVLP